MKKENKTNKRKGFLIGLLVFLLTLGLGIGIKAAWDKIQDSKDVVVNIGDNVELTLNDFELDAAFENKRLVPAEAIKGPQDVTSLVYRATTIVKNVKGANVAFNITVTNTIPGLNVNVETIGLTQIILTLTMDDVEYNEAVHIENALISITVEVVQI